MMNSLSWDGSSSTVHNRSVQVFAVQGLPPARRDGKKQLTHTDIAAYFRELMGERHQPLLQDGLLLPSLECIAGVLETSPMEVRQALGLLKQDGFDIFIPGLYGHISIWEK